MSHGAGDDLEGSVGEVLESVLSEQISVERTKKASLEARAVAFITTAGTLVTLLLGLAALVSKSTSFVLSGSAAVVLVVAGIFFAASACTAIWGLIPRGYSEIDPSSLSRLAEEGNWSKSGRNARRELALVGIERLGAWQSRNAEKAYALVASAAFDVVAVVFVAIGAILTLTQR